MIEEVYATVLKGITLCCWMKSPFCADERRSYFRMVPQVLSSARNAEPWNHTWVIQDVAPREAAGSNARQPGQGSMMCLLLWMGSEGVFEKSLEKYEFQSLSASALSCRPGCSCPSQHSQSGNLKRLSFFRVSVFLKTKARKAAPITVLQMLWVCTHTHTHTDTS